MIGAARLYGFNGLGAGGGGIVVEPSGSVSARVVLDRVRVEGNTTGILALGGGSQPIIVQIRDSVAAGNSAHGMSAVSTSGALSALVIDRTSAPSISGTASGHKERAPLFMSAARL